MSSTISDSEVVLTVDCESTIRSLNLRGRMYEGSLDKLIIFPDASGIFFMFVMHGMGRSEKEMLTKRSRGQGVWETRQIFYLDPMEDGFCQFLAARAQFPRFIKTYTTKLHI